ncbi:hypothetical protein [Sphingobacterium spiritivorum]|uniref:hypothetical protein n=1 Tax=Sphingobacterium spiritivorum TaxID=258 RepID=UPI003DA43595
MTLKVVDSMAVQIRNIFLLLLCISQSAYAQSKTDIANSKKIYEGIWRDKANNRNISISYDSTLTYVLINDWTGGMETIKDRSLSEHTDAYKAFIKGDKLILPAENDDHHAPYCEISVSADKLLIYECNGMLNFTDNFLKKSESTNTYIFKRIRD